MCKRGKPGGVVPATTAGLVTTLFKQRLPMCDLLICLATSVASSVPAFVFGVALNCCSSPNALNRWATMKRSCLVFVVLVAAVTPLAVASFFGDDLVGDYCGGQTQRCCDGRIDSCAVPLLGTFCYCDQFCNRTDSNDCCPDYWSVCLGIQPPQPLVHQHGNQCIILGAFKALLHIA